MKKNVVTGGNTKKKCRCISYRRGGYYHNCYSVLIWTWINNIFFQLSKDKNPTAYRASGSYNI